MAKYVVLMSLGEEGFTLLRGNVIAASLRKPLASSDGQLHSLHITLGAYDAVAVVELDAALMPAFTLHVKRELGEPTVLQAFDEQEASDGIRRWDGQPETGKLGP